MDIKLVKNFEEGMYIPVNREMLLQVIDDNRRFEEFNGKRIFLFNPLTNERFEIMPEIPKFNVTKVYYGEEERDYFVFTSARMINERETEITYYWYQISLQESFAIHTQTVSTESLNKNGALKAFIMSQDYCIFENKGDNFELVLRDVKNNKILKLDNEELGINGIDRIVPLSGNHCGIKVGCKTIGVINVNQFVSDMVLGLGITYTDVLDMGSDTVELLHMRKRVHMLLYVKRDTSADTEEIIMYDYENKVKRVRMNNVTYTTEDYDNIYVIDDVPYNFLKSDRGTRIINLNTQKTEIKLGSDIRVEYVFDNIVVTSIHTRKNVFFGKKSDHVKVYRFPNLHHSVYKTKGKYKGCIKHFDDLLIFVEG